MLTIDKKKTLFLISYTRHWWLLVQISGCREGYTVAFLGGVPSGPIISIQCHLFSKISPKVQYNKIQVTHLII